jgi:CBS domain containing-hemolysin-like protein
LVNRPTTFIATTLVGNNLANYLASLAVVVGVEAFFGTAAHWPALVAPILLSPLVFIYGELLPKNFFYEAPNRLLRACSGMFVACAILFSAVSVMLWAMSKLLELLSGRSPQQIQLALARKELQQVLEEGHEVGVLRLAQRGLAQGLLSTAADKVSGLATPPSRVVRVRLDMPASEVTRICRRHGLAVVAVEEPLGIRRLVGYVRVVDLYLAEDQMSLPIREMAEVSESETHIAALMKMQTAGRELARVVNASGEVVGVLNIRQLTDPLLRRGT